jgi:hypothetical protein
MEVLAFLRELPNQPLQFGKSAFGGVDRRAVFACRVTAGLARIKPELNGTRQQAVSDVPGIGLLIIVSNPIAKVHRFSKGLSKSFIELLHGGFVVFRENAGEL